MSIKLKQEVENGGKPVPNTLLVFKSAIKMTIEESCWKNLENYGKKTKGTKFFWKWFNAKYLKIPQPEHPILEYTPIFSTASTTSANLARISNFSVIKNMQIINQEHNLFSSPSLSSGTKTATLKSNDNMWTCHKNAY